MDAAKAESLVRRLANCPRALVELTGAEYLELHAAARELVEQAQYEADEASRRKSGEEAAAFNPALRAWLNERGLCSGDWPHCVTAVATREADCEFGGGYILDEAGWPIRKPTHTYVAEYGYDRVYLGS